MKVTSLNKALLIPLLLLGVLAGRKAEATYANITIDGATSDWAAVPVAYANENGVNNPTGVDFQNVYLANDANYFYIRFTLQTTQDALAGNVYIWIDNDNNPATGFQPFGNPNFGSSLMIINDTAYQEAGGGFNEGVLTTADAAYGAVANPGTDYEFRIARNVTGVAGAFSGVPLLNNTTVKVQLGTDSGTGDSLPAYANYGALSYTFSEAVPEPGIVGMLGLGGFVIYGWKRASKKAHAARA